MMKKNYKNKLIVTLLLAATSLCVTPLAQALQVDHMVFIGDSLSDQGNCANILYTPPVTNGNTFTYYLANKFGHGNDSIAAGYNSAFFNPVKGRNYACVGASTGFITTDPVLGPVKNSLQQIEYAIQDPSNFSKHSLFFYWVGADDMLLAEPIGTAFANAYPLFNANVSVNNISTGLNMLHNAGARYIIVMNMPPLERTPSGILSQGTSTYDAYVNEPKQFNQALVNQLNNLGYKVLQVDIYSLMNYLLNNYQRFGFTNITNGCTSNPAPGQVCDTSFFYNAVHPTDKTHRMLADFLYSYLTAPDFVATLAEVPLSVSQQQNSTIRQQLFPAQPPRELGKIYPFIGGNISPNTGYSLSNDRTNFTSNNYNTTLGLLKQITPEFLMGLAVGQAWSELNYDFNGSQYNLSSTGLLLFASYQKEKAYINGIINYARLQFNNIERNFPIGPVMFSAKGNTTGDQYGVSLLGGYNLMQRSDTIVGPFLTADYQRVNINGYNEDNADVFDLNYADQNNNSFIGGVGFQATFNNIVYSLPLTTNAFVSLNKEFLGGDREVYFKQASLVGANFGSLPVLEASAVTANAGVNFAAKFKNNMVAAIGFISSIGDNDLQSNMFTASLTMPLD